MKLIGAKLSDVASMRISGVSVLGGAAGEIWADASLIKNMGRGNRRAGFNGYS